MITDPQDTNKDTIQVIRGGCWYNTDQNCWSVIRNWGDLEYWDNDLGIRIVMNITDMKKLMEMNHEPTTSNT